MNNVVRFFFALLFSRFSIFFSNFVHSHILKKYVEAVPGVISFLNKHVKINNVSESIKLYLICYLL